MDPCERYEDTIHLLQNPKLPRNTMGFNNRNLSHKTLKDGALEDFNNNLLFFFLFPSSLPPVVYSVHPKWLRPLVFTNIYINRFFFNLQRWRETEQLKWEKEHKARNYIFNQHNGIFANAGIALPCCPCFLCNYFF